MRRLEKRRRFYYGILPKRMRTKTQRKHVTFCLPSNGGSVVVESIGTFDL